MLLVFIAIGAVWLIFSLDAYLVTKAPKRKHFWQMPDKAEEEDLLYTPVWEWVRQARERITHDD